MPCTTLLVGKNASYDGSTIVARNEDSSSGEFTPKKFIVVEPQDQPRHYRSVISHVEIDLPDNPMRYTALPNALPDEGIWAEAGINAANVSMSATETLTTNERVLGADPFVELVKEQGKPGDDDYAVEAPGGIGEEDMVTIVLPYIHSAREGVRRLGELLQTYGTYEMNGIAFSDVSEVWWLETIGGHHWIARKLPDDCYATVPNQLGLDEFDLADALGECREYMCSPDMADFIDRNHLDLSLEGIEGAHLNPRDAFGSHSDSDHVYNTPRAWAMQRFLNPQAARCGKLDNPEADDIPWCRQPERKITIEDVKYVLSLHYQGTPYDPYERKGDGGTKDTRDAYRPIGINRNSELSIAQIRPYVSEASRALQWIAFGSNVYNSVIPFFANIDATPAYLANTDAHVTTDNLYWSVRLIASMADAHFAACEPALERYQLKVPALGYQQVIQADAEIAEKGLSYEQAAPVLQAANQRIADALRKQTDKLLEEVLYEASMRMHNSFSRSDS